jgi:hypothetical protein
LPNRKRSKRSEKTPGRVGFAHPNHAKCRAGCANQAPSRNTRFVNKRKSFRPCAKPTRPRVLPIHVGNALAMATDMLILGADEVARNGASWKILRPEVFPNAPLHYSVCCQGALRPVSRPSPESPPGRLRISRETGGVPSTPSHTPPRLQHPNPWQPRQRFASSRGKHDSYQAKPRQARFVSSRGKHDSCQAKANTIRIRVCLQAYRKCHVMNAPLGAGFGR